MCISKRSESFKWISNAFSKQRRSVHSPGDVSRSSGDDLGLEFPCVVYHVHYGVLFGVARTQEVGFGLFFAIKIWWNATSAGWGNDMRIFRTIFSIMGMIICGWLLSFVIVIVVQALDLRGKKNHEKNTNWQTAWDEWIVIGMEVCGLPVNLTLALNFVVLYRTSQEYRTSFLIQMKALPCIGRLIQIKKATVSPNSDKTNNVNSYSWTFMLFLV